MCGFWLAAIYLNHGQIAIMTLFYMVQVMNTISCLKWLVSKAARIMLCFCYAHKHTPRHAKHIHTYTRTHTHAYTHTHTHTHKLTNIHTHTHTRTHTHLRIHHTQTYIHNILVQNYIMNDVTHAASWCPPLPVHARMQTNSNTHTHTHTHTKHTNRHNVLWCVAYALSFPLKILQSAMCVCAVLLCMPLMFVRG